MVRIDVEIFVFFGVFGFEFLFEDFCFVMDEECFENGVVFVECFWIFFVVVFFVEWFERFYVVGVLVSYMVCVEDFVIDE